jgi:rare lipoprotein A (peptidoglycan hydrolase)
LRRRLSVGLGGLLAGLVLWLGHAHAQSATPVGRSSLTSQDQRLAANPDAGEQDQATASGIDDDWRQEGRASFYGLGGRLSRFTANGARFDRWALTAAHAWLPFGTRVRVTDQLSGREIIVTITDRLASKHRIIDLSLGAAKALGILRQGLAVVMLEPG